MAKFIPEQLEMGDNPGHSSETPYYLGTISKSWSDTGKMLEVKGIPDTGCTSSTCPIAVVKEHGLQMKEVDFNEPGMEGFGGSHIDIIGQVSFYYQPRRFSKKKLIKALVSNTPGKEMLISWQLLLKWGVITKSFPYPPDSNDSTDPDDSPHTTPENFTPLHWDVNNQDSISNLTHDSAKKVNPEKVPTSDVQSEEEEDVSPISAADSPTQGEAVHNPGGSLGGATSRNVMDNSPDPKPDSEPDFEKIKMSILEEYSDIFKENLTPSDRIHGIERVEMDESAAKPVHFSTPKEIPAHLRKSADKEHKRCLEAGQLEPCNHYTKMALQGHVCGKTIKTRRSIEC